MVLRLLIDAVHPDETRVVIADNSRIHDFDFVTTAKKQVKGNIYLAKITRVEPSLQAAFVEYGNNKQGFLPFAEIHPDYYQIPMADRIRLLEEAEAHDDDAHEATGDEQSHSDLPATSEPSEGLMAAPHASAAPSVAAEAFAAPLIVHDEPISHEPASPEHVAAEPILTSSASGDEQSFEPNAAGDASSEAAQGQSEPTEVVAENQEIETLASDEDAVRSSRPGSFNRRYKIQEVIKRNQIVLVQVIKEERGNKGVSLTTFISLAGRYCVLMPNSPKGGGISRKIMSGEDRKRLKEISAELKTARGMSAIIRTAGIDRTRAEIKRDYEYLVKLWETIREQTLSSTAPALIYEESDLIKRTIRDLYSADIEEIVVEGEEGYNRAKEFMKTILPATAPRVKFYQDNVPLFYAYNIEDQLTSMYDPVVKLRSGGYIVINPTEALISIDVNSGRMTGERNIEETAAKTNLEAAQEIARQLRLRDLAGLIVIDFIDMMDSRNRRAVERTLKDSLKLDRAKIQLGRISPFGLLEMSRQRLRPSIAETSSMPCPHCQGKGLIRSDASVALQLIRVMEKEAATGLLSELRLTVPPFVALQLLNGHRNIISSIEQKFALRVVVNTDAALPQGQHRLEKIKSQNKRPQQNLPPVSVLESSMPEISDEQEGSANFNPEDSEILVSSDSGSDRPDRGERHSSHNGNSDERPRRRGRRGGRGRRDGHEGGGREGNRDNRPPRFEGEPAFAGEPQERPVAIEGAQAPIEGAQEQRPPRDRGERGDRGPRRRRGGSGGRFRDNRNRPPGDNQQSGSFGGESRPQSSEPREHAPRESQAPSLVSHQREIPQAPRSNATVPPLSAQAPSDAKPKKGWWRKIIES